MSRLTRDGTTEPVSRDQILRRERGQGNTNFPGSAYHEQDWQPYLVDPYSCFVFVTTIYTYSRWTLIRVDLSRYPTSVVLEISHVPQNIFCSKQNLFLVGGFDINTLVLCYERASVPSPLYALYFLCSRHRRRYSSHESFQSCCRLLPNPTGASYTLKECQALQETHFFRQLGLGDTLISSREKVRLPKPSEYYSCSYFIGVKF